MLQRNEWQKTVQLLPHLHLLALVFFIVLHVAASVGSWPIYWITTLFGALALASLMSVVHEAAHSTYFQSRTANELIGRASALLLFHNFMLYRHEHMMHHSHQGEGRDTELTHSIRRPLDLPVALIANVNFFGTFSRSVQAAFLNGRAKVRRDGYALIIWIFCVLSFIIFDPVLSFKIYILPFVISVFLDALISLPEHALTPLEKDDEIVTRSLNPGAVGEFFLYWVNRHREHHDKPNKSVARISTTKPAISYASFYRGLLKSLLNSRNS